MNEQGPRPEAWLERQKDPGLFAFKSVLFLLRFQRNATPQPSASLVLSSSCPEPLGKELNSGHRQGTEWPGAKQPG